MSRKTRTKSEPWEPARGAIVSLMSQYGDTYDQQRGVVSDAQSRVGDISRRVASLFADPGGTFRAGESLLADTVGGAYLRSNPYLDSVLEAAARDTADAVNSQFTAAGRYGSGAHSATLAREIGEMVSRARMGEYDLERGRQMSAASMIPAYRQSLLAPAVTAAALAEQEIGLPYTGLDRYNQGLMSLAGRYGTQTQKQTGLGNIIGAILQGANAAASAFAGGG